MADVTIKATVSATTSRGMRAVVFTSALVGYAFLTDGDLDFKYEKTTDGGATWGGLTTIYTGTVLAFDVWFDQWTPGIAGGLIHTWYIESDNNDVRYRSINTASGDALGTEVQVFDGASALGQLATFVSGAKMRGGNLYTAFCIDGGTETGTYRSTDAGVTWGVRTNIVEAVNDFAILYPGNEANTQDFQSLYFDVSATELTLKVHSDTGNTNAESAVILNINNQGLDQIQQNPVSGAIRLSDGHLIAATWNAYNSGASAFQVWDINGTGSITQKTAIATNKTNCYYPSVFVNNLTDDLYVSYVGKRDGSEVLDSAAGVYYVKSTNGGTSWSAGDTTYSVGISDWRQLWAPLGGLRFLCIWRGTATVNLTTNATNSIGFGSSGGGTSGGGGGGNAGGKGGGAAKGGGSGAPGTPGGGSAFSGQGSGIGNTHFGRSSARWI